MFSGIVWVEVIFLHSIWGRPCAMACVNGQPGSKLTGVVRFFRHSRGTLVVADIKGLPASETNFYGFHIHEGESCCGEDFADTGGHFNPCGKEHPNHAGDLPPLLGCNGRAYMAVATGRFTPEEVVGRTVVIHGHPDDFHSQPSGDSGMKIGCGVIRKV